MKTEVEVKIESGLRKPGSNMAQVNIVSSTKTAGVPATNGANSSEAIKKHVAPTKESTKKKQKSVPSAKKTILLSKKTIPSAKTSTGSEPAIKTFLSNKCYGCQQYPCTNIKMIVTTHGYLQEKYYNHLDG